VNEPGAVPPAREVPPATRAERRELTRKRTRMLTGAAVALVALIALAGVAIVGLGGGSDDKTAGPATTSTAGPGITITLEAGDLATDSAGPATSFSTSQAQQLLATIRSYVEQAVVKPLRSGEPAGDLSSVFDAGTLARVAGVDRAVMVEEGLPKVTGDIDVVAKPVSFMGLGDQSGNLVLVTASVQFTVDGSIAGVKAPLHVDQRGDLVLAPDASGAWKVTAYRMAVTRSGGGVDTTTSSAPATTKAAT
jgi:hypothetical protein